MAKLLLVSLLADLIKVIVYNDVIELFVLKVAMVLATGKLASAESSTIFKLDSYLTHSCLQK